MGLGRRDAAFDSGSSSAGVAFPAGRSDSACGARNWSLTKIMDQHAYLKIAAGDNIRVGDMIGFDIAHPCLTFDKWRTLPILNSDFQVIDVVETFF